MANKNKKIRSAQQRKELNQKIAEIIWVTLGGIIGVAGIVSLVLGTFISNMSDNFHSHPFYPLYQFQEKFFTWLKSWSHISLSSFVIFGIILPAAPAESCCSTTPFRLLPHSPRCLKRP